MMEGWQRAFVLHSRPWSETSLMLDVFTEESGRVRLVAKGPVCSAGNRKRVQKSGSRAPARGRAAH